MTLHLGNPFHANENTQEFQSAPCVVGLGQGNFALFWQSKKAATGTYEIVGRIFEASGIPKTTEIRINQLHEGTLRWVSACELKDGSVAVAWMCWGAGADLPIKLRVMRSDLASGSDETTINNNSGRHYHPEMASLRNGNFVVLWSNNVAPEPPTVNARVFSADGVPVANTQIIDSTEKHFKSHCSIANIWKSRSLLVWRDSHYIAASSSLKTDIKARVVNRNLENRSACYRVATGLEFLDIEQMQDGHKGLTAAARLDEGTAIVVYATSNGVSALILSYDGVEISPLRTISAKNGSPFVSSVSVCVQSEGNILIVWSLLSRVEGRIFDHSGSPLSDVFEISNPSLSNYRCDASALGPDFVTTWESIEKRFIARARLVSWQP